MARFPRRRTLALVVVALTVGLAGCAGLGGSAGGQPTSTTPTTATTTTAAPSTTTTTTTTSGPPAATGTMTLLLGGEEVTLSGDGGPVSFAGGTRTWQTDAENVTISEAIAEEGPTLRADAITVDGTTYDGADSGTTITVRANGHDVDPTEFTLDDGDSIWVYVAAPDLSVTPPGPYLNDGVDHEHGHIEIVRNGSSLDLAAEQYQNQNRYFHLEDGDGETWHAHTWNGTAKWALATLGFDYEDGAVTVDGQTYAADEVTLTVDGHPVEGDYRLKDGDEIRLVLGDS